MSNNPIINVMARRAFKNMLEKSSTGHQSIEDLLSNIDTWKPDMPLSANGRKEFEAAVKSLASQHKQISEDIASAKETTSTVRSSREDRLKTMKELRNLKFKQ